MMNEAEEASELRERLLVAEKVMKSLFDRNKQLEEQNEGHQTTIQRKCSQCETLAARISILESQVQH